MSKDIFDEYTVAAQPAESVGIINTDPKANAIGSVTPGERSEPVLPDESVEVEPRPLFNGRSPAYDLKAERPEHRAIVMLKAASMSNVEIAATLGISPVTVAYVVKQPWAVKQILKEIETAGREPVVELMKGACYDAAQRLIAIAETAKNEETKRKTNLNILEFCFGKPDIAITTTHTKDPSTLSDADLLRIAAEGRTN